MVEEGETVAVGDVVCIIDTSNKGKQQLLKKNRWIPRQLLSTTDNAGTLDKATPLAKEYIKQNDVSTSGLKDCEGGRF